MMNRALASMRVAAIPVLVTLSDCTSLEQHISRPTSIVGKTGRCSFIVSIEVASVYESFHDHPAFRAADTTQGFKIVKAADDGRGDVIAISAWGASGGQES